MSAVVSLAPSPGLGPGDLLAPEMAVRLGRLALVARKMVGARNRGRRRTRRIGSGIETIDLRPYDAGDDTRRIAWHAYARLERLLVRLVADEAPLRLTLVLDQSASMAFSDLQGEAGVSKIRQAKRILAGFAAVALGGEDRVALAAGSSTSATGHRAVTGRAGLGRLLAMLDPLGAEGKTDLPRAVRAALDAAPGRGLCVIASDLFEQDAVLAGAREAHRRGQDVVLVEVLTPFELAPPDLAGYDLEDAETGELVELDERDVAARYAESLAEHRAGVDEAARALGATVVRTSTAEPFESIVTRALGAGVLGGAPVTINAPLFLAALALLVPVLLAFLVKQQRHVLRVSSTMVWRLRAKTISRSRKIRDLRRLVALLLCLAGVAALIVAASRPSGKRGDLHVYVVDVSASMANGPLDAARRWLDRDIAALGPNARVAIVLAGAEARVVLSPTSPGPRVDAAVTALKPEPRAAAYEESFALADALTHANGGSVTVLSDHALEGDGIVRRPALRVFPRTGKTDNLGITSFYTRTSPDGRDEEEREAVVVVATSSAEPRRARLQVTLGGRAIADRHLALGEHGETTERITLRGAGRLVARVATDDGRSDALGIDDEASLDEMTRRAPRVALIRPHGPDASAGGFFVEKALRAAGITEIVELDSTITLPRDLATRADVTVTLGDGDVPRDLPVFAIGVTPIVLGLTSRPVSQDHAHLRSLATEEPLLRGVALDGVTTLRGLVADPPSGSRTLIDLDGGPTLLAGGKGTDAWVWLGIDPAASDLVLRVAFPVLVGNVLAELGGAAQVVTARTVPRAEVALVEGPPREPLPPATEPRWRIPARPAMLLAFVGALLLGFEAWFSLRRRGAMEPKHATVAPNDAVPA